VYYPFGLPFLTQRFYLISTEKTEESWLPLAFYYRCPEYSRATLTKMSIIIIIIIIIGIL